MISNQENKLDKMLIYLFRIEKKRQSTNYFIPKCNLQVGFTQMQIRERRKPTTTTTTKTYKIKKLKSLKKIKKKLKNFKKKIKKLKFITKKEYIR